MTQDTIENGKPLAIISYLTLIGTIVAYFLNKDKDNNPFVNFHVRQALGIWLAFHALGICIGILDMSLVRLAFYFCFGVLLIYGFINAVVGNTQKVPVVGGLFQKLFANLGK